MGLFKKAKENGSTKEEELEYNVHIQVPGDGRMHTFDDEKEANDFYLLVEEGMRKGKIIEVNKENKHKINGVHIVSVRMTKNIKQEKHDEDYY